MKLQVGKYSYNNNGKFKDLYLYVGGIIRYPTQLSFPLKWKNRRGNLLEIEYTYEKQKVSCRMYIEDRKIVAD